MKLKESFTIQATVDKQSANLQESADGTPFIMPRIEAIHAGTTKNFNHYLPEKLKGDFELKINLKEIQEKEEEYFDKLVADNNLDGLISRYPVRETPALTKIATGLGMTRDKYESAVRKLIIDDNDTKDYFKTLLEPLTTIIEK